MDIEAFKTYTQEEAAKLLKALAKFSIKEVKGEGTFEVVMTKEVTDRDGEIVDVAGIDTTNFMKNPVLLFGHDYWSWPIGAITEVVKEGDQMIAKGVFARTEEGQKARLLYDDGILRAVSIGFIPKTREGNRITSSELLELSFVPVPSNPEALDAAKRVKELEDHLKKTAQITISKKEVVAYKETEKAPENTEWDGKAAVEKVKEWASDGDKGIDFDRFKEAFAYFDGEDAEKIGSYKLPHHTVVGDKLTVVWQGVLGSMAALLSEDGAGIPEDQRKAVYDHLAKHYKEFDKEPPAFKSYSQYELDQLFPALKEEIPEDVKGQVDHIVKTLKSDVNCLVADAVEKIESAMGTSKQSAKPNEKAGRTLSGKTRASINNAVEAMTKAVESLTKLLEQADAADDGAGKAEDVALLKALQGSDKVIEEAIKAVKARIK